MKIFFDGGFRPAPGGMELAVVARGRSYIERDLGLGSSMDAEWLALIAAMRLTCVLRVEFAVLLGDAASVIAQANGVVRVPPAYRGHHRIFAELPRPFKGVRIRYIKRTQNLAGIALSRLVRG